MKGLNPTWNDENDAKKQLGSLNNQMIYLGKLPRHSDSSSDLLKVQIPVMENIFFCLKS